MSTVIMQAVCSVDGFIADEQDGVGSMFAWYENGDVQVPLFGGDQPLRVSRASADHVRPLWDRMRVQVIGRHLFDITDGWNGVAPTEGGRVIVVSHRPRPDDWHERHPDAPYEFVTSIDAAITRAKEIASDGLICVSAGDVGGQAFAAGLVDEIEMDLAPVVLGCGKRFFGSYEAAAELLLENPTVVQGDRVTHLHYRVRR
ncbi:dihydrofolate reductase family protein [Luteipulveratus sp. YIM 133132]|uniref:dihydrofolate reductase family protein n=1 Tax=Luteipulveratus flavus TaxID=3031728 RepID=UPI0023AF42F7|nr:dihydrofolate reductase family protein [Luteipulveratus sp. YIM 133132]MDE9367172.1 dihydrofolate reductase family protein [Luteipulveratus sp. YIM 133132]